MIKAIVATKSNVLNFVANLTCSSRIFSSTSSTLALQTLLKLLNHGLLPLHILIIVTSNFLMKGIVGIRI